MTQAKKPRLSTTQLIILGFLAAVLVGSVLLTLPIASASGQMTPYLDALFTSATSVCVTGLTVVDTFSHWSLFGKIVILLLIQLGGLGVISFTTGIMVLIGRKITLKDRLLLESAFNLDNLSGLLRFLGKVFAGTMVVEGVGALLSMLVFCPEYGLRGIWISVFHSISAFCNAGIDIIGPNSLVPYVSNVGLNLVTMALIILGGIGFIVWWDVLRVAGLVRQGEIRRRLFWQRLTLHTKITLTTTAILIVGGALVIALLEWNNPETLGALDPGTRVLAAFFQSVTTRTAGYATVTQSGLRAGTVLVSVILMFIGGSSVGTAGGVKTSTIAVIFLSAASVVRGRESVTAFRRTLPEKLVRRASAIVAISLATLLGGTMLLSAFEGCSLSDALFEMASALGTVGLTSGLSADLTDPGKLLLTCGMYFGRVGPMSLAIAFAYRKGDRSTAYPEQNITLG